ncbi:MAG: PAS domain-containing protein, partial [Pyrinomonadaceae bacterium]
MALLNRLNHNNEWLTDILESSCEGIVVEEHDRIVYANDAFASLHGYDGPAELIGRHTSCFQARTEHGRVGAYGGMRLKGEPAPAAYEFKGVRKDGSEVELEASVSTFTSGGRSFIITTLRDITERKQAETRLEESEQRYRSLFEHHPDAVYSLDLAGRLQSANPTCYALTGYTDALLGQPFLPLLVPEHVEKGLRHFRRAISGEPQKFEVAITSQGGRRIELSITNLPIFIDGKIAGVYGIAQDITERLRARAALAERENLLQAMFDAGPECVKLIARDGTLLNMNRSGLAMIEVESLEQAVGKNVYQLVTAECRQSFIELN